jgi:hypothetical protein
MIVACSRGDGAAACQRRLYSRAADTAKSEIAGVTEALQRLRAGDDFRAR